MTHSECESVPRTTEDLLLACTRAVLDDAAADRIVQLAQVDTVDWERARVIAKTHGIQPLLSRNLRQAAPHLVPVSVLRNLEHDTLVSAARNLALCVELIQATDLLNEAGFRAIPFKGPIIALALYGSPHLREYADLDILIDGRDAQSAVELLASRGYSRVGAPGHNGHVSARPHSSLIGPHTGCVIELQWNIGTRWELSQSGRQVPMAFDDLWSRRGSLVFCGSPLPNLSAEDTLLMLSVHGARHHWNRAIWLCDVAQLLRTHPVLRWEWVMRTAADYHCVRRVLLALRLASDLLGAELPCFMLDRVNSDPALPAIAGGVRQRLFDTLSGSAPGPKVRHRQTECRMDLDELALSVSSRERWRERIRLWLRFLGARMKPSAADRESLALPARLTAAYYFIRPMRLCCVYGARSVVRLFRVLWAGSAWWTESHQPRRQTPRSRTAYRQAAGPAPEVIRGPYAED